jgi:Na+-transporting methylmalonyl-CoA/oxaloacetate decarboxylase gamma subunit
MANAIWISVIGMALVFLGLVLLWGMMALLVQLTSTKSLPADMLEKEETKVTLTDQIDVEELRMAAAVAVATALASTAESLRKVQLRESGGMTPWQVAHRNYSLSQNQSITRRKG